jgi:RNA polymerase sigma-70 factor (ECF subfamily)
MTQVEEDLARVFELERPRLRAVAARILGPTTEADDAVQETWFRLERASTAEIANLGAWLTVVVTRIALDHVRARTSRREETIDTPTAIALHAAGSSESAVIFEESIYEALSHALDRLSPFESAAFILHDLFRLPFEEIAAVIDRSPEATRKLASRARTKVSAGRVRQAEPHRSHRAIVEAFLHAARSGDLNGLIALLAPDAVFRADQATVQMGVQAELLGAADVAGRFAGGAQVLRVAWLDGDPGAVWAHQGHVRVAFAFEIQDGLIQQIQLRSDPDFLSSTEIELEPPSRRRRAGG